MQNQDVFRRQWSGLRLRQVLGRNLLRYLAQQLP
jgi:hypothetical protein